MRCKILLVSCAIILAATSAVWGASRNVRLVGRETLGSAKDIFVVGNYAYLCAGCTLVVLEVSDPPQPTEVGRIVTPGLAFGLHVSGNHAYVVEKEGSLYVIDVSVPTNPRGMGSCNIPGEARQVDVAGNCAYVASVHYELSPHGRSVHSSLRVVDVSDPMKPHEVGFCDIPSSAEEVYVVDDYAYVSSVKGFSIVDVSDPAMFDIIKVSHLIIGAME